MLIIVYLMAEGISHLGKDVKLPYESIWCLGRYASGYTLIFTLNKLSHSVSSGGTEGSYEGVAGSIIDLRNRLCPSVSDCLLRGDASASVGERGSTVEGFSSMTEAKSSTLKCLTQSAIKTGYNASADLIGSRLISHLIRTVRSIYQYNLKEVRL